MAEVVPDSVRARRGDLAALFAAVALATTAFFGALTLTSVVIVQLTGFTETSGVPGAMAILGTAVGSQAISRFMAKRGRVVGMLIGWALGVLGAVVCAAGVLLTSWALLLVGMPFIGFGFGSSQLARFAAADLVNAEQKATAVGIVVWGNVVGAVAGPALLQPSADVAARAGLAAGSGGLVVAVIGYALALAVLPLFARSAWPKPAAADALPLARVPSIAAEPRLRTAVAVLLVNQVAMVLLMAPTPAHVAAVGSGLGVVAFVMSSHFIGMFAFAPFIGRGVDRFGAFPMMVLGMGILVLGAASVALRPTDTGLLPLPLLALGLGWSCTFVCASAALTRGLTGRGLVLLQGRVDTLVWTSAGATSLAAGFGLARVGFASLGVASAVVIAFAFVWLLSERRAVGSL